MVYTPTAWKDAPSGETPITAEELNRIEQGVVEAHSGLDVERVTRTVALEEVVADIQAETAARVAQSVTFAPGVSPLSHGAVGDGSTNDTAAILAAAAAAQAQDRALIFPPGYTFRMTADLPLWSGAVVHGDGATVDLRTDGTTVGRRLLLQSCTNVKVRGLTLTCSNATARNQSQGMVTIFGGSDILLEDLTITAGEGAGIITLPANTSTASGPSRVRIVRPRISGVYADGIHITRGTHDSWVIDAHVSATGDDAISVTSTLTDDGVTMYNPCQRIQIVNATVVNRTSGPGGGVALYGAKDCTILGGLADNIAIGNGLQISALTSGGNGVATHADSDNITVVGFHARGCAVGFYVGLSTDAHLSGCSASTNSDCGAQFINATRTVWSAGQLDRNTVFGLYATGGTGNRMTTTSLRNNGTGASNVDAGTTVDATNF